MRLAVVLEQRFDLVPEGSVWTPNAFARSFWDRYLDVFDEVAIVARAQRVESPRDNWHRVDGDGVRLVPVPYYVGPASFLTRAGAVRRVVEEAMAEADAVILRAPGTLSNVSFRFLCETKRPFGLEVVGDPHDIFASGVVRHPARILFRAWFRRSLRRQCARATVVAYVTERTLQRRYPPGPETWATHYSSVELPPEAFVDAPSRQIGRPPRVVTIASLEQPYKGVDTLIEATAILKERGFALGVHVVGEGRLRADLEAFAEARGVEEEVRFVGGLPDPAAVRTELDQADVFVLASRAEGLPRAMIEAMARGLACVGTRVGGIPELLPAEASVPPNDPSALADALARAAADPEHRSAMQHRNLERARAFSRANLEARRREMYGRLHRTAAFSRSHG